MKALETLHAFFCTHFSSSELRRFIAFGEHGDAIRLRLPGENTPHIELVDAVIDQLRERNLLMKTVVRIRAEYPYLKAKVDRLAAALQLPPPEPPRPTHRRGATFALLALVGTIGVALGVVIPVTNTTGPTKTTVSPNTESRGTSGTDLTPPSSSEPETDAARLGSGNPSSEIKDPPPTPEPKRKYGYKRPPSPPETDPVPPPPPPFDPRDVKFTPNLSTCDGADEFLADSVRMIITISDSALRHVDFQNTVTQDPKFIRCVTRKVRATIESSSPKWPPGTYELTFLKADLL
jgi:hypothetical protein